MHAAFLHFLHNGRRGVRKMWRGKKNKLKNKNGPDICLRTQKERIKIFDHVCGFQVGSTASANLVSTERGANITLTSVSLRPVKMAELAQMASIRIPASVCQVISTALLGYLVGWFSLTSLFGQLWSNVLRRKCTFGLPAQTFYLLLPVYFCF